MHLWDYAFELTAYILTVTSNPHILFGDQTGYQIITQIKPDISQYASFDFYSLVWHWDEVSKQKTIGRWFGVAETEKKNCKIYFKSLLFISLKSDTEVD